MNEEKVIQNMEKNPQLLFTYMNESKYEKAVTEPFKVGDRYENDSYDICSMLSEQFKSVFSSKCYKKYEEFEDDYSILCFLHFLHSNPKNESSIPGITSLWYKKNKKHSCKISMVK